MFRDLPPYEETRFSDFWTSKVPSSWSEMPGLAVLEENRRTNKGLVEDQVLSLSYGKVIVKPVEKQRGLVPESYEGYQILDPGDIVVRPTDLQNDQTSIRVGHVRDRGIITSAYIGLRPRGEWSDAYAYLYLSVIDSSKRIYGMGSGLRQQLGWEDLKRMPCLVPPVEEQAAIVKYLAHANARIDNAIAAKRRLVALLEEQQRVILNEWMLAAPKGDLVPVKALLRPVRSTVGETHRQKTLLSLTLRGVIPRDLENVKGKFPSDFSTYQDVRPGQFVFCLFDVDETPRTVGLSRVEGMITGAYDVFDVGDPSASEYLELFFTAMDNEKAYRPLYSGLRKVLPHDRFLRTFVPFPDAALRQSIVDEIRASRAETDSVITRVSHEVDLLQEFRTRLVADVVTGQVDVRAVSASLPHVSPQDLASSDAATVDGDHFMSDAEGAPE